MTSAPLIPNLFDVCVVLVLAIVWVIDQILYALAGLIPPLNGLAQWFDPIARQRLGMGLLQSELLIVLITWLIAVTVMVIWATLINLLTMMWVERKFYSRLQDRYGIMISIWSLPFWPFNRAHRPTHRGTGYLQNIADGVKLLQKENITPRNADSAMFHISPSSSPRRRS